MDAVLVYVTAAGAAEAETIARTVVSERLAACANLLGPIRSVYWWEGRMCEGDEVALVFKTTDEGQKALVDRICALHSYQCPCIACLPITGGNPAFLQWIHESVSPQGRIAD